MSDLVKIGMKYWDDEQVPKPTFSEYLNFYDILLSLFASIE